MEMVNIGLIGLLAEGLGLAIGMISLYAFQIKNGRNMGMLYGVTSGLMLAMICFDILPEAFDKGKMELVFCGIILGMLLGIVLDDLVEMIENKCPTAHIKHIGRTGLILTLGIAIHNLPEGFALGTLAHASKETIYGLALVLALHSIPEGMALSIPFKNVHTPIGVLLCIAGILGGMMGLGAILGYGISAINPHLMSTGLGVAGGIILYIVCGELIPESRKIWNGRWTTIATILGVMAGILLLKH